MDYKWFEIRKKIIGFCKKTYTEQGMSIPTSEIEKATDLFDRIVSYHLQFPAIGNLQADIQQSLQGAFIDNKGASADLRNVLNLMDAYLKKLLVMSGLKTQTELTRSEPSLKPLLQMAHVSATFDGLTMHLDESSLDTYDKDPSGAYILCYTYHARNKVHGSPEWDDEDVMVRLRYAVATYVLATYKLGGNVLANYPNLATSARIDLSEINETGYVYDFINYGNSSNKIKNRIVESFILNYVYKKAGAPVTVDTIVKEVVAFSKQSLSDGSIRSIIGKLIPGKLQYDNVARKEVTLKEEEQNRIKVALDGYTMLVSRLMTDIENLLDGFSLKDRTREVYERLKLFFEANCMSIIQIMNEDDGEKSNERSEECIDEFKQFLKHLGCTDDKKDELFKGLLQICQMNDVLVKISLGKNFTNISNPESFASGLPQREKKVYLDTQLLLYALCDYEQFAPYNGSPSFLIVKSLVSMARHNPNIKLATINQYVNEVAYHLKRAVQLITFDDLYRESRIQLSDNVFYSYYYYLKDNGLLNEKVECLADFLQEMFGVGYDDLLQGNLEQKNYSYIVELLEEDYSIAVEDTPHFGEADVENSEKVFTTALLERKDGRSQVAAKKDAIMGLYLFSSGHKATSDPFFLSWDKAFYAYRKEYIKAFIKSNGAAWHLFSPAKFVNHLNLLDMKIDVDVLTEDLISIIEDEDTATNTKRVLDSIRKLFEKSNVNGRQKRKEYTQIIFNETEFPNDTVVPEEKRLKMTSDFAIAFDRLLTMMQTGSHKLAEFTEIISDEKRFRAIVVAMRKRLDTENVEQCASSVFAEIEKELSLKDK